MMNRFHPEHNTGMVIICGSQEVQHLLQIAMIWNERYSLWIYGPASVRDFKGRYLAPPEDL